MALRPLGDDEVFRLPKGRLQRARFYADEMVEDEAIEFLKRNKVNVQSARELGLAGRDDSFHVGYARSKKRFLLTKDRHFLSDRKYPLNSIPGIVVIQADMTRVQDYSTCLNLILGFVVPYGHLYYGSKVEVTPSRIRKRFVGIDGKVVEVEFRLPAGKWYTSA